MFQSLTACLPGCLRTPHVQEPMDDVAARPDSTATARGAQSVRGPQGMLGHADRFSWMREVHEQLQQVETWPRSSKLLGLLNEGRGLLCDAIVLNRVEGALNERYTRWQEALHPFKDTWTQMQVLPQHEVQRVQRLLRQPLPPACKALVDEQLLYARQDAELAGQAFGEARCGAALQLDASAEQHLTLARRLIALLAQAPEALQSQVIQVMERCRASNSFLEAERLLAQLLPSPPALSRSPVISGRQQSTTSSDGGEVPTTPRQWLDRLHALRQRAGELPSQHHLRPSVMALCKSFEQAVSGGPLPRDTEPMQQLLFALENKVEADSQVRGFQRVADAELSSLSQALQAAPAAMRYRLAEARDRVAQLTVAYRNEDYDKASHLYQDATRTNTITQTLLADKTDLTGLERRFEHRNGLVQTANPWLSRPPQSFQDRLRRDHLQQLLKLFDETADASAHQSLLYELDQAIQSFSRSGDRRQARAAL